MSFGFSVGDFVQLGSLAWRLYTQIQNAPVELKVVADDVGMLHYTLKSMDENVVRSASLGADATKGLQEIANRCRAVLGELEPLVIKYGRAKLSTWHKIKWQRVDMDGIQRRLKAALQALNSFNSAVALWVPATQKRLSALLTESGSRSLSLTMNSSQVYMIKKLNKIQFDVQSGKREGSVITRAELDSTSEGDPDLLSGVMEELGTEGVSLEDVAANKLFITRWIVKGIKSGAWEEQAPATLDPYSSLLEDDVRSSFPQSARVEILSACWATMDVTEKMRKFITTNVHASTKTRSFTPSNTFFGHDPIVGWNKAFVMVWRLRLDLEINGAYRYSVPSVIRALQGQLVTFDYEAKLAPFEPQYSTDSHGSIILDATWFNMDVTSTVRRLIGDRFDLDFGLFERDPYHGGPKSLLVTYIYRSQDYASDYHMQIFCGHHAVFNQGRHEVYIPLPLTIHAAMWSTEDITDILRAQVSTAQSLNIDTRDHMITPDPWPGKRKTIVVVYQYGSDPLQIAVSFESNGTLTIDPNKPRRPVFFNPIPSQPHRMYVLAVVWGIMPTDLKHFGLISDLKEFPCTNEWFGFDGWPKYHKSCYVFVQYPHNGRIVGVVAREGEVLKLPVDTLQELEANFAGEISDDSNED